MQENNAIPRNDENLNPEELIQLMRKATEKINELKRELNMCRNELCLKCGDYKTAHLGSCNGCRWKNG